MVHMHFFCVHGSLPPSVGWVTGGSNRSKRNWKADQESNVAVHRVTSDFMGQLLGSHAPQPWSSGSLQLHILTLFAWHVCALGLLQHTLDIR